MLIQLIHDKVLLRINAHQFYFLIYLFELKDIYIKLERKESFIVNFIYNLYTLPPKKEKCKNTIGNVWKRNTQSTTQ